MVEAGTGVGKSFAYLVPAILAAAEGGLKVVVSTHTISLQEQLMTKDLPFLRAVMPQEFSAVLVKGRSNYVSLRRMHAATARAGRASPRPRISTSSPGSSSGRGRRATAAGRTSTSALPRRSGTPWPARTATASVGSARTYKDCFYYQARRRMRTANILVVNHALFMTDLALRAADAGFLPDYDVAIFDEAHTLEAVAGDHLGLRISNAQVEYALTRLYNERSRKGLLAYHALHEAMAQAEAGLVRLGGLLRRRRPTGRRAGGDQRPAPQALAGAATPSARSCASWPRRSAGGRRGSSRRSSGSS